MAMKSLIILIIFPLSLWGADLTMEIYKKKDCSGPKELKSIPLDKLYCDQDMMIGQYFMIDCLTRGISRVWTQYGDSNCKTAAPSPKGGHGPFEKESCQYDKVTGKSYKFDFEFNTEGALCSFQKCISECKKEEKCKKSCKAELNKRL